MMTETVEQEDNVVSVPKKRNEPVALVSAMTPMMMLDRAIGQGAGIEVLEKLMALHERWEASQARKAFDTAIAAAKAEIPVIPKNRTVDFTSAKGRTNYRYEDLGEVVRTIVPILATHGLSHRFRTTSATNEPVTVTCIISHRDGHYEENTLCAGRDITGNKNDIQAIGSTLTYLQRMTLKAALGLAASEDEDGAANANKPKLSPEDTQNIRDKVTAGKLSSDKFLTWAKTKWPNVEKIEDISADDYDACVEAIENAVRAAQKKTSP